MWQLIQDNFISNYHEYLGDLHHMLVALSKIQTFVFSWTPLLYTHPHKKGPVMKNYTRHLTSFSIVIYQAKHNLWCPVNVGWENFAQLQKFQVK